MSEMESAWKACLDGLPTKLNLVKRGLNIGAECPLCEKAVESSSHALIYCNKLCEVWWNWQDCPINLLHENRCFVDLALEILDAGSLDDLGTFLVTAWAIWYNRNQVVHESKCSSHSQIWNLAVRTQEDYNSAELYCRLQQQQAPDVGWAAPSPDVYKINVDGATAGNGGRSSVGVVIRDYRGLVVAAACKVLNGDYGVAVTEAFAVEEGIRLATEMELQRITVESDSCVVVDAINERRCNGDIGTIIIGSLELLQSFRSWKVQHLKRDYNRAAHELAQFAKTTGSSQQWKGIEPPVIQHVLLIDRAKC